MPTHSTLHPDVQGSFEVTLARALNTTRKRLPIRTAISGYRRRFLSLAKHQRQGLAAALQSEYHRRSAGLCDDEVALQALNEQYSNAQCFVTPIHRLPDEILMETFRIVFDINPSPIRVVLACLVPRRWGDDWTSVLRRVRYLDGPENRAACRGWDGKSTAQYYSSQTRILNLEDRLVSRTLHSP